MMIVYNRVSLTTYFFKEREMPDCFDEAYLDIDEIHDLPTGEKETILPLQDTRRFKRDAVLGLMLNKGWIPRMESCPELDLCIRKAEEDLERGEEIDTLEDYVYHINYIFCCEWDASIQGWSNGDDE